MAVLFNPGKLGSLSLKNRFVRSATAECLFNDAGRVTENYLKVYKRLAKGGVGLIITGNYYVNDAGRHLPRMPVLEKNEILEDLKRVADTVHENDSKIVAQINHAGRQSDLRVVDRPIAPSAVLDMASRIKPRAMTEREIEETILAFGKSAQKIKEAGFDGVQIHAAHGYLINQFLSRRTNRRKDQWGGERVNRRRFLVEVYKQIRTHVGPDFPVLLKINGQDYIRNGTTIDETVGVCRHMDSLGIDGIEVSGGTGEQGLVSIRGDIPKDLMVRDRNIFERMAISLLLNYLRKKAVFKESYHLSQAAEVKKNVSVPVISVGGMRSVKSMEKILEQGEADFVSLSRPFIRQPNLVNLIEKGRPDPITCVNCNRCALEVVMHFNPLQCYYHEG